MHEHAHCAGGVVDIERGLRLDVEPLKVIVPAGEVQHAAAVHVDRAEAKVFERDARRFLGRSEDLRTRLRIETFRYDKLDDAIAWAGGAKK